MKTNKVFLLALVMIISIISACKKEKAEGEIPKTSEPITTKEGSRFELTSLGNTESISGTFVTLGSGQLLNGSFYRQFNVSTNKGSLYLRFSFPSAMVGKVEANMYKEHSLYEFPLSLQESGNIQGVIAEGYFSNTSSAFFKSGNLKGTVLLREKYLYNEKTYSVFGEININLYGKDENYYNLVGIFWKE